MSNGRHDWRRQGDAAVRTILATAVAIVTSSTDHPRLASPRGRWSSLVLWPIPGQRRGMEAAKVWERWRCSCRASQWKMTRSGIAQGRQRAVGDCSRMATGIPFWTGSGDRGACGLEWRGGRANTRELLLLNAPYAALGGRHWGMIGKLEVPLPKSSNASRNLQPDHGLSFNHWYRNSKKTPSCGSYQRTIWVLKRCAVILSLDHSTSRCLCILPCFTLASSKRWILCDHVIWTGVGGK